MRYTTLQKVRTALSVPNSGRFAAGSVQDEQLIDFIEAAEEGIDLYVGDPTPAAESASPRVFRAGSGRTLIVNWFTGPVSVRRVSANGRLEEPVDGTFVRGHETKYRGRCRIVGPWRQHAEYEVTARWGNPRVSPRLRTASLMVSTRLWHRQDSPLGLATGPEGGQAYVAKMDRDVVALLRPYRNPLWPTLL